MARPAESEAEAEVKCRFLREKTCGVDCDQDCLNYQCMVECTDATCSRGEACRNRRFQRREGVKLNKLRCGAKGWGLCSEEDLKQAQVDREAAKAAMAEATTLREKEAAAYATTKADYDANIAALGKAITAVDKGASGSFVQTDEIGRAHV